MHTKHIAISNDKLTLTYKNYADVFAIYRQFMRNNPIFRELTLYHRIIDTPLPTNLKKFFLSAVQNYSTERYTAIRHDLEQRKTSTLKLGERDTDEPTNIKKYRDYPGNALRDNHALHDITLLQDFMGIVEYLPICTDNEFLSRIYINHTENHYAPIHEYRMILWPRTHESQIWEGAQKQFSANKLNYARTAAEINANEQLFQALQAIGIISYALPRLSGAALLNGLVHAVYQAKEDIEYRLSQQTLSDTNTIFIQKLIAHAQEIIDNDRAAQAAKFRHR